jgi:predicted ATPase
MSEARKAFPGIIDKIEFDRGDAYLFGPNATDPADGLPPQRAADGVLTGLLHLTAIASTPKGGLVAFDEMENQLHPHAIRSILAAMRERAEERDLTVILTTHSPVVMNAFRHHLDHFYVLELANQGQPKSLDELHDEEWLAQSFLGELYENLEFGAPELS